MMLLRLFWEFFKIGLFAVGGGMATIPFLYDLSDRTGWFTYTQLADMIAISESTPGPIGVNMATYVGYEMSGVLGSISTTLGFVAPSIIIIVIVSIFLQKFRDNRYVESAFYGLRPASSGLIASAALSVAIVALLHDLCKIGCYKPGTRNVKGSDGRWLELWYPVAEHPLAGGGAGGVFGHCDQPEADQKVAPYCVPGFFRCGGHCVSLCGGVKRRLPKVFCRAAGRKMWLLYCI